VPDADDEDDEAVDAAVELALELEVAPPADAELDMSPVELDMSPVEVDVVLPPGMHSGFVLTPVGQQMSALPPSSFEVLQMRPVSQSSFPF
jgi:hypothetical protein